ncbi:MAG: acyl-CoA synthetase (AMP-forming)/AMP-acid ligase [Bacteroidetes bacterium]|nr:acyl-CoA synthetase (AMP-forming)/AMP-acid ligase [Bacteroidota bacterium]
MTDLSIYQLLGKQTGQRPNAVAILAPDRIPLTYGDLYLQIVKTVKQLNSIGIHRHDRVAIVLPNGPEMATAFLSVAAGATSAPLNPAYRSSEFEFYLSDLNARALIIHADLDSPARKAAQARGIPVIDLTHDPKQPAGVFELIGDVVHSAPEVEYAQPDDVGLVLHTSGTTSRPKIVPLTHLNLCTSANNVAASLTLTESDRCLNVMPLFHIHGLVGAVLSSLTAGASLVCTPGFHADQFFQWMAGFHPTWYTAVPTMHQAVLARVDTNRDVVAGSSLRFIRSSSASLPPQVMAALEEAFKVPVIESYGMTEASHQMTSNPLPPGQRRPGTVGVAAGPEVAIMDEAGNFLSAGESGEIVIRGNNVTRGYETNETANQSAFFKGWFRTGDQGVMDGDGYLRIIGRIKEIVNRGGEKIAPREIDETFLSHPDVVQAVAFAVPHPTLGEDLAVAVVLREKSVVTHIELRKFAFANLAAFKVPSQVIIVEEIPRGPTGKLQRIGLAEKLASKLKADYAPPRNPLEEALVKIWTGKLNARHLGIHDNFFALGGDSLTAVQVLVEIERLTGKVLHQSILFAAPTVEQLASVLENGVSESAGSYLLPIQSKGVRVPFFCVPGHGGDVFTFVDLSNNLGSEQPVYVFKFPDHAARNDEIANSMIDELAISYVDEMRAVQPNGPYFLIGFCFGGEVVFRMAQRLLGQNQIVGLVAIIHAYLPGSIRFVGFEERIRHHRDMFRQINSKEKLKYLLARLKNLASRMSNKLSVAISHRRFKAQDPSHSHRPLPIAISLFRPIEGFSNLMSYDPQMGWRGMAAEVKVFEVPGNKTTMLKEPQVRILAEQLRSCLEEELA